MKDLDHNELVTVTGGAAATANTSSKINPETELALTKLASDIKDLGRNSTQNQNSQLTTLLFVAVASKMRNGG